METTIFTVAQIDAHRAILSGIGVDLYRPLPGNVTFLELLTQIDTLVRFSLQDGEIMNTGTLYVDADGRMAYRQEQLFVAETISLVDASDYGPEFRIDYRKVGDHWEAVAPRISYKEINAMPALRRMADVVTDDYLEWKLEDDWSVMIATAHAPGDLYVTLTPPPLSVFYFDEVPVATTAEAVDTVNRLLIEFEDILAPALGEDEEDNIFAAAEVAANRAGFDLQLV